MANLVLYSNFRLRQHNGNAINLASAPIKVALLTAAYVPDVAVDQLFASVSSGKEVSGGAYSAGGQTIAGSAVALDGATPEWTHDDVVWSQHASGFATARYAVWHDSGSGRLIGYLDLTSNRGNVNGPLTLDVTAATGIASF
ncbi:hypothetical protein ACFOMD_01770 [Sphingoaurantiacus capsulatus]|uniref:Uncharacterized protein n=1 Tax=Sphingoaurantiacus capsulatus TaxID=1771310 RepID=A0ABV7X7H8_9SPHN